ncbi:MAG: hypothetical protein ACR2H4_18770, partial [Pyrinomonadaceae bacterium]
TAISETRAAVAQLRSQFGGELGQMQRVSTVALGQVTQSLAQVGGQMPLVGSAVNALNSQFANVTTASAGASAGIAGLAGVAVIGAAATGALVTAVITLGKEFFNLTKQTAEYQGKLLDTSQKTGFMVETLSGLQVLAKNTGGSIDGISASLVIFEKNMEKASTGQGEMSKKFKQLNIDTLDNEKALRQAFTALAQMPEGARQAATALALFGRSGKDVLAIVKETNGNLDEAIAKFSEMGLIVSTEAAIAADRFNDSLELMEGQLAAVGRTLTESSIPAFTAFFEDISKALSGNQESWRAWQEVILNVTATTLGTLEGFVNWVRDNFNTSLLGNILEAKQSIGQRAIASITASEVQAITQRAARGSRGSDDGVGGGGGGGKANTAAQKAFAAALKAAALAEREAQQVIAESIAENHRARDEQVREIEEFTKREIELSDQRLNAIIDRVNAEQSAIERAHRQKLITQAEFDLKDRELSLQTRQAVQKNSDDTFKLEQERDREIAEAELAANRRANQIAEDADQRQIERIKSRIQRQEILESEGEQQIAAILAEGFARRKKALEAETDSYATSLERKAAINGELIRLDGERAKSAEDAAKRISQAQFDEQNAAAKGATRPRRVFLEQEEEEGREQNPFDALNKAIQGMDEGIQKTLAGGALDAMSLAFSTLGQAVGQAVEAFVLFGSAGTSVRKVTAEILAGIAKQAAIKAVFELAQGFAALALAFFGVPNAGLSAGAHFKAAAIYGAIAGIAAIAGRGVAGDAFSQNGSTTNRGATQQGTSSGSTTQRRAPEAVDIDRRVASSQTQAADIAAAVRQGMEGFVLKAEITRDEGSTVRMWVDNYRGNGLVRKMVTEDGG